MNCKNCELILESSYDYCSQCGAKVIKERISISHLFSDVLNAFGWESKFFVTLRSLFLKPQTILKEYLGGTRKKYTNPFAFFAIISALSLFVFTSFSDEFIYMMTHMDSSAIEATEILLADSVVDPECEEEVVPGNPFANKEALEFQLKYQNILSFLFLPLYALLAFFVFGKPYNFGEHLVINTYLQGISSLFILILFAISLSIGVNIFGLGMFLVPMLYYCFAYKKLYDYSIGKILLKTLKFVGILFLFFLIPVIIGVAIGVASKG